MVNTEPLDLFDDPLQAFLGNIPPQPHLPRYGTHHQEFPVHLLRKVLKSSTAPSRSAEQTCTGTTARAPHATQEFAHAEHSIGACSKTVDRPGDQPKLLPRTIRISDTAPFGNCVVTASADANARSRTGDQPQPPHIAAQNHGSCTAPATVDGRLHTAVQNPNPVAMPAHRPPAVSVVHDIPPRHATRTCLNPSNEASLKKSTTVAREPDGTETPSVATAVTSTSRPGPVAVLLPQAEIKHAALNASPPYGSVIKSGAARVRTIDPAVASSARNSDGGGGGDPVLPSGQADTNSTRSAQQLLSLTTAPGEQRKAQVERDKGVRLTGTHDGGCRGPVNHRHAAAAVSMVASFLKQGTRMALPSSPSRATQQSSANSPLTTPVSLASLVSGVPECRGSATSSRRQKRQRSPTNGGGCVEAAMSVTSARPTSALSPDTSTARRGVTGGSRFLNEEWPVRVKERRRIIRFPKRSQPPGTRILFWVRGSFRVRDNLALSVAMWLSTQLRMPLQALTFVDPAVGRVAPSYACPDDRRLGGHGKIPGGHDTQNALPFRMAVEASALCEMEHALRALNIPLVALACPESEIPTVLTRWCSGHSNGGEISSAGVTASAAVMKSPAAAAAASVAATTAQAEGGVHIAIADESYHPRQLWLVEKVGDALPGVALYTVDSCSCCPVNTFHGGRASTDGKVVSQGEFRQAQDAVLRIVCTELAHRPRLPLEARLQVPVFIGGMGGRAALPPSFAAVLPAGGGGSTTPVHIDWGRLRALSARRFPAFEKPTSQPSDQDASPCEQHDLIAAMGGGERVGRAALQKTLTMVSALAEREQEATAVSQAHNCAGDADVACEGKYDSLYNELSGAGFGGTLLHLLRLGSISPLYVVQAVLDNAKDISESGHEVGTSSKGWARLLDAVLNREYALYRAYFYYQREGRAGIITSIATAGRSTLGARGQMWKITDWLRLIPQWVVDELQRAPRDARQHPYSPEEIRRAGSTVPSTIQDTLFSAIQVGLTDGGRLHPSLAPYWARAVVRMVLIPSQAIALVISFAEELCLGAAHAGDIVPDLLANAFHAFEETPPRSRPLSAVNSATTLRTDSQADMPTFLWLSDSSAALHERMQWVLGGVDAFERFMLPSLARPARPGY